MKFIVQWLIVFVVCGLFIVLVSLKHVSDDLRCVTSGKSREEIHRHFASRWREPIYIYKRGDVVPNLGWEVPQREIEYEMEVYDSDLAVRIYVFYTYDGKVSFVFSSSS